MDSVFINGLALEAVIGIHDWERTQRQPVVLDLEMAADCATAACSDDIADALDYFAVSEALTELVEQSSYQLIESLAEACAQQVMTRFGVRWLRLRLTKPAAVPAARGGVGVIIERGVRP
ncbi:MAG: dihydroneopterin aldolase [Spongiibacteraceae bacterium]|jgi:dihydroneopterin aldolase|nr:dihydroneopterin aldolase [Spongiibacteraceae bacterium]